jgi:enoyl-[acyl-carrier-protein] reductase (NADH)
VTSRSDDDVARVFREVSEVFDGGLDLLVHSVAFAAAEDLEAVSRTRREIASGWRSTSVLTRSSLVPGRRSR